MKCVYGAVIRRDEGGGWWAEVPDLPGCFGQGDTLMDAVASASDAVETHVAAMVADGLDLPRASHVEADDGEVVYVYADPATVDLGKPSVTASEAARRLGVSAGRVTQLIADGRLRARRTAAGTLVTVESVEAYARTPRAAGRPRAAVTA